MNLELIYIEGISREDTLYFRSILRQTQYFTRHVVVNIQSNGFYPPYYQNSIKLSTEDLELDTKVNYLRILYNDKYYYYFIDNVAYISEEVISIDITMDTIQTFMFDLKIFSGIIERKFIDRYVDGKINRNYIRENFSDGNFLIKDMKLYTTSASFEKHNDEDTTGYMLIIKTTDKLDDDGTAPAISTSPEVTLRFPESDGTYENTDCLSGIINSYIYYCVPFPYSVPYDNVRNNLTAVVQKEDGTTKQILVQPENISKDILDDPRIVSAYYVPFNCLPIRLREDFYIDCEDNTSTTTTHTYSFCITYGPGDDDDNGCIFRLPQKSCEIVPLLDSYTFDFTENSNPSVKFDIKYEPALLDINYIRYTFGDISSRATFDLFYALDNKVWNCYFNDLDGNRYYRLNPNSPLFSLDYEYDGNLTFLNVLENLVFSAPSFVDVLTDSWKQYKSYNSYAWAGALATTAANVVFAGYGYKVDAGIASSNLMHDLSEIYRKSSTYDKRYKNKNIVVRSGAQRRIDELERQYGNTQAQQQAALAQQIGGSGGGLISEAIRETNARYAPDIAKTQGNIKLDYILGAMQVFSKLEVVQDIERCAQYYHRYGYRVDEYIDTSIYDENTTNIFDYVNTRYYYSYVKIREINIDLSRLEDARDIEDIELRFRAGLRIWNNDLINSDIIGDYEKDNPEREL